MARFELNRDNIDLNNANLAGLQNNRAKLQRFLAKRPSRARF